MNRLDPNLETRAHYRILSPGDVAHWTADDFALAVRIAHAPLTVTGGLTSTRIRLDLAPQNSPENLQPPVVSVPLNMADTKIHLHAAGDALDGLAGLLERGRQNEGAGATLSLDAVEALLAALLAPLDDVAVGQATWTDQHDPMPLCALHFDGVSFPLFGSSSALETFRKAFASKVDQLVAAPLSYLKDPSRERVAVESETVLGAVQVSAEEAQALEIGGGILLDSLWPQGRDVVAGRFAKLGDNWQLMEQQEGTLHVRAGDGLMLLDQASDQTASQASTGPDGQHLELMDRERCVAHGYLTSIIRDDKMSPVFVVTQLLGLPS
ncbi:MAG: hypothetical protein AB8B88_13605 [Devosiaceae bacterium]